MWSTVRPRSSSMSTCTPCSPTTTRFSQAHASMLLMLSLPFILYQGSGCLRRVSIIILTCVLMQATRNIADAALLFKRLRGFVHLSTAYVNCNRRRGSHVEERLYSFTADGEPDKEAQRCRSSACRASGDAELEGVEALAQELAALPEGAASQRVSLTRRLPSVVADRLSARGFGTPKAMRTQPCRHESHLSLALTCVILPWRL